MAPRLPLPRRGLRSVVVVLVILLVPYLFFQRWMENLDPAASARGLMRKSSWREYYNPMLPRTLAGRAAKPIADAAEIPPIAQKAIPTDLTGEPRHRHRNKRPKAKEEDVKAQLPQHRYLPNGLVKINPRGQHPIHDLIERGKKAWKAKHDKASKTLTQAVKEYRRRYNRSPPKGFDRWWLYVTKHNVQLPDEYDQINKDLEPFFAYRSTDLVSRIEVVKRLSGMYTISCKNRRCSYDLTLEGLNAEGRRVIEQRAEAQMSLIKEIERELPNVDAVFYSHDGPWQFVDHGYKSSLEDAASSGEFIPKEDQDLDTTHLGWASACAPHKPLRTSHDPEALPDLEDLWQGEKTFIWDHKASMDPCLHPSLTHTVGFLSSHGKGPGPSQDIYPVMAMCKTLLHSDVLGVSMEAWTEDVGDDPSWEEKMDERMLWRGKTTGILFQDNVPWQISQRVNLVDHGARMTGQLPVLPPASVNVPLGQAALHDMAVLNQELVDVAFVDEPIQCDPETCERMKKELFFADRMDWSQANNYKYLLDIDGNGWSARFKRLMTTNSLILKSTIFPEWYTDRVQPWVHYAPIKPDLTDLYDVLTFFRANDDLAKDIALNGREWSLTYWRKEDMVAYQYRLFLELARLLSPNREASTYHHPLQ